MNKLRTAAGMLAGGLVALALAAGRAPTATPAPAPTAGPATGTTPAVVVGTFDSRAIAIAYVGSSDFQAYIGAQQGDVARLIERAQAAGDTRLVGELEALGPAMQARIHDQGFGTAPVDDILATVGGRLPDVARTAGVDVIVSKWALAHSAPGARFVDVTEPLAGLFEPDARTWKSIREIVETDPVPPGQMRHDH